MQRLHHLLLSWGPLGLFLFALLDGLGLPNPGGTDLFLLLLTIAHANPWECAALAIAGSVVGSAIFYEVISRGGERWLLRFVSGPRGQRFRTWFLRYGLVTVFIPALLPVPLPFKAFAACAAALGVRRSTFLLVIAAARIPRYFALAYLGAELGENSVHWVTAHTWQLAVLAVALAALLFVLIRVADRTRT
ncbi:MAG TPA: VTT domain-containing protein [Bryobacteraceae bacterium]|nr:VTT domain-containing protein [Bryobacteraceae bacterium]